MKQFIYIFILTALTSQTLIAETYTSNGPLVGIWSGIVETTYPANDSTTRLYRLEITDKQLIAYTGDDLDTLLKLGSTHTERIDDHQLLAHIVRESEEWIEVFLFTLVRTETDSARLFISRIVNNIQLYPNDKARHFTYTFEGTFDREPGHELPAYSGSIPNFEKIDQQVLNGFRELVCTAIKSECNGLLESDCNKAVEVAFNVCPRNHLHMALREGINSEEAQRENLALIDCLMENTAIKLEHSDVNCDAEERLSRNEQ